MKRVGAPLKTVLYNSEPPQISRGGIFIQINPHRKQSAPTFDNPKENDHPHPLKLTTRLVRPKLFPQNQSVAAVRFLTH